MVQARERRRLDAVADLMKCYGMLRLRRGEACLVPWFTFPSREAGVYILRRNPIRRDEACLAPTPRQHEIANSIGSPLYLVNMRSPTASARRLRNGIEWIVFCRRAAGAPGLISYNSCIGKRTP